MVSCAWGRHMRRDACHAGAPRETNACPAGWSSENLERLPTKKAVLVLATAATIGITALVTSSPAQAWRGGWGGWRAGPAGGVIAGTVIGGIVAGVPAHGPGYCYYRGPDDYYARGAYYGPWCYMGYQYGR
jgi:hypothetical protein